MGVLDQNGNVIKDSSMVFDKRKTEFSILLNQSDDQRPELNHIDIMQSINFNADEDASLAREFSLLDVQRAVCNIKKNERLGLMQSQWKSLKMVALYPFYINYAICVMILVKFQIYGASL